jgi:hypothetical protein
MTPKSDPATKKLASVADASQALRDVLLQLAELGRRRREENRQGVNHADKQ